jgi:alkanesulfonate monooxygenase SsuD/methylene tetrahydromethanopterin reductase-like flavin-dependent oxidoreductase (luciferase family)
LPHEKEAVASFLGLAMVGSPETVIREIEARRQRLGYDMLCTNHQLGRMPRELVSTSIELFGREVIPAFA